MLSFSHKSWSLIFAVSETTMETTVSTTTVENTLVRPWVREGVARGTSGPRMTGMGMEQWASTMPLEVRVDDMSGILGADIVFTGAQAILSKSAVKMDLTTLEMKGAQEARVSFAMLEL